MDKVLLLVIVYVKVLTVCEALDCFKCSSVKIKTESGPASSILSVLPESSVADDEACHDGGIDKAFTIPTETCPNDGYRCTDVRGSLTVGNNYLGSVTYEMIVRGCTMASSDGLSLNGDCSKDTKYIKQAANIFLSVLTEFPLTQVDGEVCYCDTSLCTAGSCADDSVKIFGYCAPIWIVAVVAVGAVLLLAAVTCCCCCCCCGGCCCCKKSTPGIVLQPVTIMPGQHNPMYDRLQEDSIA